MHLFSSCFVPSCRVCARRICMITFVDLKTFHWNYISFKVPCPEKYKSSILIEEEEERILQPQSDNQTSNEMWQVQVSWDVRLLCDVWECWENRLFPCNLLVSVPVLDRWVMLPLDKNNSKHPSIHFLYPAYPVRGHGGGWSLSQRTLGERQVSTLTGQQSHKINKNSHLKEM